MTQHTGYKTRDDGTIDYAHYMARGRAMRSAAFLAALRKLRPTGPTARLFAARAAVRKLATARPVGRSRDPAVHLAE